MSDELVKKWLWSKYIQDEEASPHFVGCPDAEMTFVLEDGEYGCDTGCEYMRLEARIKCEHTDLVHTIDYGEFGDTHYFIRELEQFEKNPNQPYGRTYGGGSIRIYAW